MLRGIGKLAKVTCTEGHAGASTPKSLHGLRQCVQTSARSLSHRTSFPAKVTFSQTQEKSRVRGPCRGAPAQPRWHRPRTSAGPAPLDGAGFLGAFCRGCLSTGALSGVTVPGG